MRPLFSIVLVVKNEEKTLPRLFKSLQDFMDRGGEICILDTGSSDNTVSLAKSFGAKVVEVGSTFIKTISEEEADVINSKFDWDGLPLVRYLDRLFTFDEARNYVSSLASNNMICTLDADEAYSVFDIDKINAYIEEGYTQFEYHFVYAHDANGNPAVSFTQSKFFDRRVLRWKNKVHEILVPISEPKVKYLPQDVILLEHWQEPGKEHRSNYLPGLALDCFLNPANDRNLFYLSREMMYHGRYKSAIASFLEHQKFNGWDAERAQGLIFIGDCYGHLNLPDKQVEYYHKGFDAYPKRREALIKLAHFYKFNNIPHAAAAFANASLVIPRSYFYADNDAEYREIPHEILYWACGNIGDIEAAKWHLTKCLEFQPHNQKYQYDTRYYFEYPCSEIDGWMTYKEQCFLYEEAKKHNKILELGSWKGRSTSALLSGCKNGTVFAVDTWEGSKDPSDDSHWLAKKENIYDIFIENTKHYKNLIVIKNKGVEAAKMFPNESLDFVFIDAGHTYEEVVEDITSWMPKVRVGGILAGHDYSKSWPGVVGAVTDLLDQPDELHDTIWVYRKK